MIIASFHAQNDSSGASPASVAQESKVDHAELIIDVGPLLP